MADEVKNPLLPEAEVTFCLIKPHAVNAGAVHEITTFLERNKFVVLAHKKLFLTEEIIRELFRPAPGAIPERLLRAMYGPVVLLELTRKDAISVLRKLAGDDIPANASPGTLHYMYGADQYFNSILAPRNKEEFDEMLEKLEVWFQVYTRAITENEADPLERARDRFVQMMAFGDKEAEEEASDDNAKEMVGSYPDHAGGESGADITS